MSSWSNIAAVAKRELISFFSSPIAYVFIVIFLLLSGFFTFAVGGGRFFARGQADLGSFILWHPWLYMFLVAAVGMRLWSEERRLGTMELLLTLPITAWQAILGKYLASWLFLAIALFLTFPVVITIGYLGKPDYGPVISGYFGSFLLAGAFLAISSFTSALTRNQVVSFILSLVISLFLILAGFPPITDLLSSWVSPRVLEAIAGISVITHFDNFSQGVIDLRDVIFFLSIIGLFLFITSVILRIHRTAA